MFTKSCTHTATKGEYKKKNARDRAAEKPLIVEPEGMHSLILHDYLSLYAIYIIVFFVLFSLFVSPFVCGFLCYFSISMSMSLLPSYLSMGTHNTFLYLVTSYTSISCYTQSLLRH